MMHIMHLRLLLIEDDQEAAAALLEGLVAHGHQVDHAVDGESGLDMAGGGRCDALIVDRMLPGLDGLVLIRRLRERGNNAPVLVLSALGEVDDRVDGFHAGGDDYLVKPYALVELRARLEALVRRRGPSALSPDRLRLADLELDLVSHRVTRAGRPIRLQPRELRLLEYLMRHAGRTVTRRMLLEQVWGLYFDPQTNVVETQISRLRSKIDRGYETSLLHTVRGAGYRLDENP